MPRPEPKYVTFEIDGREISAPEGISLVDGAKYGDVEIPVFCYEPKLGQAVGACRMCLVEVEGIPKLQTACSTAVQDGMAVITNSPRVREAQNAVVEFLLINHPLDCPVCDKGGECPLQDISFGWGAGRSRFIEPKRHFEKPLELSPLVAIDRERCILCYRCVRFSQEVAEDYQLVFLERADHTYVGTHHGHPYVAPFSGNIVDLCPVGALTSSAYRFRARPWDIENGGSICTICPSQCNVTFSVRDDSKVLRVFARDNAKVDDGWLCDRGRFGFQAVHAPERITRPMVRDGGALREVSWERALETAAEGLRRAGPATAALAGGETTNEEGFLLQRLMREGLGSPHVDSRPGGPLDPGQARALARPDLAAMVPDIDHAGAVLVVDTELQDEMPILDLRVRKAIRRFGVKTVVIGGRPGALDPTADAIVRTAPGASEAALGALAAALGEVEPVEHAPSERRMPRDVAQAPLGGLDERQHGEPDEQGRSLDQGGLDALAGKAGTSAESVRNAAALLRDAGPVVVVWAERLSHGARGREAVAALLALAGALEVAGTEGAGLIEVPSGTNSRGLREVGCIPNLGPGLADAPEAGLPAADIARALGGELSALVLLHADPVRTHPDRAAWRRALAGAGFTVAFADFESEATRHANIVFPAESYAEREGTVTHPDGRLQRVRQAIGHPGEIRPAWSVLAELAVRLGAGSDPPLLTSPMVSRAIFEGVPFLAGITLEEIGGKGKRWQERGAAADVPAGAEMPSPGELESPPELAEPANGDLRLGTTRSLWAGRETEHAPILAFLAPRQRVELSPADGERLGIETGDEVEVARDGARVRAAAAVRDALPPRSVYLLEGVEESSASELGDGAAATVTVTRAEPR
ncbi:MAG TPA: NADH-quinone oxidoreductase subunit NuoG [Thermoleophilaceae bacterium]|nr:NADH-quinone oxidoreductase subunit NuoG [Thermoleophilaceae bacterium]